MTTGRTWKLLGLAGVAGVAATGAVLARAERRRRAVTPEDVRARLHARHAELASEQSAAAPAASTAAAPSPRGWRRLLRRR